MRGGARKGAGAPATGRKRKSVLLSLRLDTVRDLSATSNRSAFVDASVSEMMRRLRLLPLDDCESAKSTGRTVMLRLREATRMPIGWTVINSQTHAMLLPTPGAARATAEIINQLITQEIPRTCES